MDEWLHLSILSFIRQNQNREKPICECKGAGLRLFRVSVVSFLFHRLNPLWTQCWGSYQINVNQNLDPALFSLNRQMLQPFCPTSILLPSENSIWIQAPREGLVNGHYGEKERSQHPITTSTCGTCGKIKADLKKSKSDIPIWVNCASCQHCCYNALILSSASD